MIVKLKRRPKWAQRALQGVAYWMGHRHCLYRDYPLSEGALVAEVCNLIYANLPEDLQLLCEVQYSSFVKSDPLPEILQRKIRADLVVAEQPERKGANPVPKFVIEVKRASAPASQVNADLSRLAAARRLCPGIRFFFSSFPNHYGRSDLLIKKAARSSENIQYQNQTGITGSDAPGKPRMLSRSPSVRSMHASSRYMRASPSNRGNMNVERTTMQLMHSRQTLQ